MYFNTKVNHIPTVTVAISAYNEETNIGSFLRSVLAQKEEGFTIKRIVVHVDGSQDNTYKTAVSTHSSKVKVLRHNVRIGKSERLNEIYRSLDSDILVQSDADVIFSHPLVIRDLIAPLIGNKNVWMCGGNPQPVNGATFTEKADVLTYNVYQSLLRALRGGNNVFSADGRILAYKREFVKKIHIPRDMIANDVYTYFCCRRLGYEYRKVDQAVVHFRCPQSFEDKMKQNMRGAAVRIRMMKYFGEDVVQREFAIPVSTRLKSMLLQGMKDPIKSFYIFAINYYCSLKARENEQQLTALWPMAWSTKKL